MKFTAQGVVKLDARATPAARRRVKLVFTITDSGIGLSKPELKKLFRPFRQANVEIARRYGGTGLGLALVKHLAKLMGGDLTVSSAPGRGSSFRFSAVLPLATGAANEDARARQIGQPGRRLAILCVEDNPYGRVILNTILSELGHRADFVGSGEEAIVAAARGYDLVLMDMMLPGINGREAARGIRALPGKVGRTPIIAISGRGDVGEAESARAAGINFYLGKPLSPSALNEAIAAVVPA